MDNASIHHVKQATALIEEIGAIPIFLPPYSPDIMPIEECFSKVKSFLRANDPQVLQESEIEDRVLASFRFSVLFPINNNPTTAVAAVVNASVSESFLGGLETAPANSGIEGGVSKLLC